MQGPRATNIKVLLVLAVTLVPLLALGQNAVEPLLIVEHSEYVKGEAILFKAGRQSRELVDPRNLMATECRLSVQGTDGTVLFSSTDPELGVYDGPSRIRELSRIYLLNDLIPLDRGSFRIDRTCGNRTISQEITVKESTRSMNVNLSMEFPDGVDPAENEPLKIDFKITNGQDHPIRIVRPMSNYLTYPVVLGSTKGASNGMCLLRPPGYFEIAQGANFRTRISPSTLQGLTTIDLAAGESYSASMRVELRGCATRPGLQRFGISVAIMAWLVPDADQPAIHIFQRSTGCYDSSGLKTDVDCMFPPLDWASHLPINSSLELPSNLLDPAK